MHGMWAASFSCPLETGLRTVDSDYLSNGDVSSASGLLGLRRPSEARAISAQGWGQSTRKGSSRERVSRVTASPGIPRYWRAYRREW